MSKISTTCSSSIADQFVVFVAVEIAPFSSGHQWRFTLCVAILHVRIRTVGLPDTKVVNFIAVVSAKNVYYYGAIIYTKFFNKNAKKFLKNLIHPMCLMFNLKNACKKKAWTLKKYTAKGRIKKKMCKKGTWDVIGKNLKKIKNTNNPKNRKNCNK